MSGKRAEGNTHCGRWVRSDMDKHGVRRLTCTLPRYHGGEWHKHRYTGWMWSLPLTALVGVASRPPVWRIVREWCCLGWIEEESRRCGRTFTGTEDQARVKGWRILVEGFGNGDQLCPECGKPDPETLRLVRDLERSVGR